MTVVLHDVVGDPGEKSEEALLAAHVDQLSDTIEAVGIEPVVEQTGLNESTVTAIAAGDASVAADLDIEAVAVILAVSDPGLDAETILAEARQALLLGMTAGVLNVDRVAGETGLPLEPQAVQGMVEGRYPMTLRQYVAIQRVIAAHGP